MLTLIQHVQQYLDNRITLRDFETWFEDNMQEDYGNPQDNTLRRAIDAALAEYHFDHIGQMALRQQLAAALHVRQTT